MLKLPIVPQHSVCYCTRFGVSTAIINIGRERRRAKRKKKRSVEVSQVFLSETVVLCSTKQNFLHVPAPFLFLPQFSYFAAHLFVYFLSTVTTTLTFLLFSVHHNLHISILHISIVQWGKNRNVVVVVEREKKCGCFLIVPSEVIIRGHHHES